MTSSDFPQIEDKYGFKLGQVKRGTPLGGGGTLVMGHIPDPVRDVAMGDLTPALCVFKWLHTAP